MNKSGWVIVNNNLVKLSKRHKCCGCVWATVLQQKVLCARMPCVRENGRTGVSVEQGMTEQADPSKRRAAGT